jgi:hypothetical protein
MTAAGGPILWLIVLVAGVLVLAGALVYGTMMWRKRSRDPVLQEIRDEETRRNYDRPERG